MKNEEIIARTTKSHFDKYQAMAKNTKSWENESEVLGFSKSAMTAMFKEDKNLNNIPLKRWYNLAYWINVGNSLSEKVCTAKHKAIYEFIGAKFESYH